MRVVVEGNPIDVPDDASVDEIDAIHRALYGPDVNASAPSTASLLAGVGKQALLEDPTLFAGPGAKVAASILGQTVGRPYNAALQTVASVIKQTGEQDQSPLQYLQKILYNPEALQKGMIENKAPGVAEYTTPQGAARLGQAGEPLAQTLNLLLGFAPGNAVKGSIPSASPEVPVVTPEVPLRPSAPLIQEYSQAAKASGGEAARLLSEKNALLSEIVDLQRQQGALPEGGLRVEPTSNQVGLQTKLSELVNLAQEKGQRAADLIAQGRTQKGVVKSELNAPNLRGVVTLDTPASFAMLPHEVRVLTDELITPEILQLSKENAPKATGMRQLLRASVGDPSMVVLKEEPHAFPVVTKLTQGAVRRQTFEARGNDILGVDQGGTWEQLGKLKKKQPEAYLDLQKNVVKALENRDTAPAYLKTPFEKEVYEKSKAVFDFYGPLLEKEGVKLSENYFTHQVLSEEKLLDALYTNLPEELRAGVEKRRSANLPYSTDVESVMKYYVDQVSRSLAYKPAIRAYQALGTKSPATAELVKSVLFPDTVGSNFTSWLMRKRFDAFTRYNVISAFENRSQVHLALAQSDPKVGGLYKTLTKQADAVGIDADLARAYIGQSEDVGSLGKRHVHGNWADQLGFMGSEFQNRMESRAIGFAEELVNNPVYKELRKQGVGEVEAAKQTLLDPNVKARALQRADAITANSQFEMEAGFRPGAQEALAKSPITQPLGQFTRYPISSVEAVMNSLTKDGRELTILSKGLSDESSLVAHLRALRSIRDGALNAAKKYPGKAAGFNKLAENLTQDMEPMEAAAKKLPQTTTAHAFYHLGRMWGRTFLAKAGKNALKVAIGSLLFGQKPDPGKELRNAALQSIPGFGFISVLSQFLGVGGSQYPVTPKNLAIDMGVLASPLAPLESIPGRPLSKAIKTILK